MLYISNRTIIKEVEISKIHSILQYYQTVMKSFISTPEKFNECQQKVVELIFNVFKYNRFITTKGTNYQDLLLQNPVILSV